MSHPSLHAALTPRKPALEFAASGTTVSFAELEERSNRGAQLLRSLGLRAADHIAVLIENRPEFFEVYWAAQRAGLYFTPVSTWLKAAEVAYIVRDCGAAPFVVSSRYAEVAAEAAALLAGLRCLSVGGALPGHTAWEDATAAQPARPIDDECAGNHMLYSSGTTGRPKGVKLPFTPHPIATETALMRRAREIYGFGADTVYLSPAPLYHSGPMSYSAG